MTGSTMTRPLRSSPITGPSSLLRGSPSLTNASVLSACSVELERTPRTASPPSAGVGDGRSTPGSGHRRLPWRAGQRRTARRPLMGCCVDSENRRYAETLCENVGGLTDHEMSALGGISTVGNARRPSLAQLMLSVSPSVRMARPKS